MNIEKNKVDLSIRVYVKFPDIEEIAISVKKITKETFLKLPKDTLELLFGQFAHEFYREWLKHQLIPKAKP